LALPALGSFLFSPRALGDLNTCEIANLQLLEAIRSLAVTYTSQSRRVVDYNNLGAEELGSVYESLLELHPELNAETATFELKVAAGSERKTTGSYYTPTVLIDCILDAALEPVIEHARRQPDPERALLKLRVVDPACGSGHFLIAAAHRMAKHLAALRTGEGEPPPNAVRTALRDVIGRSIYGVDVNPMAVELCTDGAFAGITVGAAGPAGIPLDRHAFRPFRLGRGQIMLFLAVSGPVSGTPLMKFSARASLGFCLPAVAPGVSTAPPALPARHVCAPRPTRHSLDDSDAEQLWRFLRCDWPPFPIVSVRTDYPRSVLDKSGPVQRIAAAKSESLLSKLDGLRSSAY
jgi:hypothetical protein